MVDRHYPRKKPDNPLSQVFTDNFKHNSLTRPNHRHSTASAGLLMGQLLTSLGLIAACMFSSSTVSISRLMIWQEPKFYAQAAAASVYTITAINNAFEQEINPMVGFIDSTVSVVSST